MNPSIQELFTAVPPTYKLLNQILTLGQDSVWRKRAARLAASGGGKRWLDACGGTGEMAGELSRQAKDGTHIFVADFSLPMMTKAREKPEAKRIIFTLADMKCLPFRSEAFDVVTISFAARNLSISQDNLLECLGEFHRVLKPGGLFVNL
ncbi:MAG TPA: class I SAM-dependent methyltransferase, partial [Candidatus Marinimicrobia bacterium]|nr:class I SAM-dependent methyltransferase [Candidatus Neomarinimicrobiota bacterium]